MKSGSICQDYERCRPKWYDRVDHGMRGCVSSSNRKDVTQSLVIYWIKPQIGKLERDNRMKRRLLSLTAALVSVLFTASAFADHHMPASLGYGQSYSLSVSDPAALVGAITKFRASPTGKNSPSRVVINQIIAGGESGATHTIGVFFDSAADIDKGRAMNQGSKDLAAATAVLQSSSERLSVSLFSVLRRNVKEGAVTSENPVSLTYGLAVTDPAAFLAAFDKIWASTASAFPGNAFFGINMANGESGATHFVSFQANDMATLLNGIQELQASAEMAEYNANAPSFRSVASESISIRIMDSGM